MIVKTEQELAESVKAAPGPLHIRGGGTRDIGNPVDGNVLSTAGLNGVTLYEPGALTIVAQAGTPVADIETALDAENQRLAFEPMDHRRLLGSSGTPTIGGIVATNASGPRRISVGACRDHLLGVRFVDGSGTIIKNGGRVMKNVTGYDLVKLMAGSYGTLGVLSEVSLKVLPKPETETTLVLHDLTLRDSVTAMSAALGSPFEVTGAAFVNGLAHIRIEGFEASVAYRAGKLRDLLAKFGEITQTEDAASAAMWRDIRDVKCFADHGAVTRVSIKPSAAPEFAESLGQTRGADLAMDWGGGLMWFAVTETEEATHKALQDMSAGKGGHATLIKGSASMRADAPVFQPENPTVTALSQGLRAKFDPRGILNAGLMG
ncbi:glycolate oxidase FAD binding subunit [Octadecabacter temperatus]|uniref:Putative FAD-linked oxidoreductase n=1 Tax=Octadecabacter temperatus TaxID=1458307 RepID=A0A0K0Y8M6_9RHOB|nr:glycolate oxidase subunit GlcE [Octadecabacter temperatus]AKS47265.1 putative FAD-linked oxidoreductase [Octadecabacter temperatus]SIO44646.1 glycolate oxidase FAD binding subunit [Octadecabacter temperatus]